MTTYYILIINVSILITLQLNQIYIYMAIFIFTKYFNGCFKKNKVVEKGIKKFIREVLQ